MIAALLFVGYLALLHTAGHALAGIGPVTIVVAVLGIILLAGGLIVVTATMVRRRRAAAGGCLTCRYPCREPVAMRLRGHNGQAGAGIGVAAPSWPERPLTRAALPVVVIPGQRPADGERVSDVRAGIADH